MGPLAAGERGGAVGRVAAAAHAEAGHGVGEKVLLGEVGTDAVDGLEHALADLMDEGSAVPVVGLAAEMFNVVMEEIGDVSAFAEDGVVFIYGDVMGVEEFGEVGDKAVDGEFVGVGGGLGEGENAAGEMADAVIVHVHVVGH